MADLSTWAPTRALGRAILVCGLCVFLAVLLGRFDLVVLAAPFAISVAWALHRERPQAPLLELEPPADPAREGSEVTVGVRLHNPGPSRLSPVVVRLAASPWLRLQRGDHPVAVSLPPGETRVVMRGPALRWGRQRVGPADTYAAGVGGLLLCDPVTTGTAEIPVYPVPEPFRAGDAMPRASILVGSHRSRRPGEGGELAGIRQFSPGDKLRRIDWRVTLRTREVHVTHTLSDRDAEVVILMDVLQEAGVSGGISGAASVLDRTVRAAAAIGEHYLRQGDRVALMEHSSISRYLRPASGRRQYQALLEWLLDTRAEHGSRIAPRGGVDLRLIPNSALVVVLSPFIGPHGAEATATLARAGRAVIAVDTLGSIANEPIPGTAWTLLGQRLWRLQRAATIGQLREAGVPVTSWVGVGSLDQVLRDMTRMAAAPRLAVR